jgi:hypothetical protein
MAYGITAQVFRINIAEAYLSLTDIHAHAGARAHIHTAGFKITSSMLISTLKLAPGLHSLHGVDKLARTTLPQFAIYRTKLS